jgi:hypothetical protein
MRRRVFLALDAGAPTPAARSVEDEESEEEEEDEPEGEVGTVESSEGELRAALHSDDSALSASEGDTSGRTRRSTETTTVFRRAEPYCSSRKKVARARPLARVPRRDGVRLSRALRVVACSNRTHSTSEGSKTPTLSLSAEVSPASAPEPEEAEAEVGAGGESSCLL